MKQKSTNAVGLDIGSFSIKVVEMRPTSEGAKVVNAQVIPLASAANLSEHLKHLFPNPEAFGKSLRIAVAGPSVLIRRVQLPLMTPAELKGAIRFEAETHIPFPIDECHLDFQILGQNVEEKNMNVLLVAAKRDHIAERLKAFEEYGLVPEIIDSETIALSNAFRALAEESQHQAKSFGLLHIGHRMSLLGVYHAGQLYFTREMSSGSAHVTEALMQAKSLSEADAEHLKSSTGDTDVKKAVQDGLAGLVDELSGAVEYFESAAGEELKTFWLSGGGALLSEAPAYLTEQLGGRQVQTWDPSKMLSVDEHADKDYLAKHAAELTVALGLALPRGAGGAV